MSWWHESIQRLLLIPQDDEDKDTPLSAAVDQIKHVPEFLTKVKHQLHANGHALNKQEKAALEASMEAVRHAYGEYKKDKAEDTQTDEHVQLTVGLLEHMYKLSELYIKFMRSLDKHSTNKLGKEY